MASAYEKIQRSFEHGCTFTFTNSSGSEIDGATMRVEEDTLGMVVDPVDDGETGLLLYKHPKIAIPKASGTAISKGAVVTWDVADEEANDDDSNNSIIGRAVEDAAGTDAEVVVDLTNEEPVA